MNLSQKPLAMAYVPWQKFENVLDGGCGLAQGSVFEDLIFPFIGAQAACQSLRKPESFSSYSGNNYNQNRMQYSGNCSCGRRGGF